MGLGLVLPETSHMAQNMRFKSVDSIYMPFAVDSDRAYQVKLAYKTSAKLTRYQCQKCKKYVIFVGECGNLTSEVLGIEEGA